MLDTFMEMMSYPFMVRAFLVGSLVALCSALLGVSLVLKRYSMIGDGLSHVGFGALAIAAALNMAPLAVAIPVVVVAAVLLSTGALAIGIMVISMTTGMNTDVYNYMFGSILAMSGEDVQFSILLSVAVLILYLFFYNKIFAITFDETFARATGVRANLYNTLIAVLTAVTIVLGMRMMGALLISSLIIFPALTSMRVFMPDSGSDDFLCVCNTGRCECSCGQYGNAGCLQCDRSPEKQKQREVNANWIKKDQEKEIDKDKNTPYNEDKFQQRKPLKFSV